jgi:hypothetical protein
MSGGRFEYREYVINDIAGYVKHEISKSGQPKSEREIKEIKRWMDDDYFEKYPEELNHYQYPDEVINEFKKGYEILRKAAIYAKRIDYLLSGDDGDDSFVKRLKNELKNLDDELSKENFDEFLDEDEY